MSSMGTLQEERLALVGKSYGSIRERLVLCYTCGKPIVGDKMYTVPSTRKLKKDIFHSTARECADAEPLARDWYRQNDRTKTHHRTKARLQESHGYQGESYDSMPVWLGDMESEDNL